MMIHPTAIVDGAAKLDASVRVGAYSVIGPNVEIGAHTSIASHVVVRGPTRIGSGNIIHSHACLGDAPQDLSFHDDPTRLVIGDRNVIREFVTMHRGTLKGGGITQVGNDCFFMAYTHVAHDCEIGDGVVMANSSTLAGHVAVEKFVTIAGLVAVHQFVRIGCHAMLGGGSIVVQDVPPYMMVCGGHARVYGLNRVGLERAGFSPATRQNLKNAFRILYRSGLGFPDVCDKLREASPTTPEVEHLVNFLRKSKRGILR